MRIVKLSSQHGETLASFPCKSLAAAHCRQRERVSALTFVAEGLSAQAVAQRLGRYRGTVES
jgi:hypothetical protein